MDDDFINTDNLIFNPNDYAEKAGDIDLNELDDRYVNVVGDTMSHLNVSSIQLYEQSTISFADNTIQTTAFNQDVVNNMIAEYTNTNQILTTNNTFTGTNTFNEAILLKNEVKIYDFTGQNQTWALTISQRGKRSFYSNPLTSGTHEFWNQGRQSLILTDANINMMNKPVIGVKSIKFEDGTIQSTAVNNATVSSHSYTLTPLTYVSVPVPNQEPLDELLTIDCKYIKLKGDVEINDRDILQEITTNTNDIASINSNSNTWINDVNASSHDLYNVNEITAQTITLNGTDLNNRISTIEGDISTIENNITSLTSTITPLLYTEQQRATQTISMMEDWVIQPITLTNNGTIHGKDIFWILTGSSSGVQLTNNTTANDENSREHPGIILLRLFHSSSSGFLSHGTLTFGTTQAVFSDCFLASRTVFKIGEREFVGLGVNTHPDFNVRIGLSNDTAYASAIYWECVGNNAWKLYVNGTLVFTSTAFLNFTAGPWLSVYFIKITGGIRAIIEFSGKPSTQEVFNYVGTLPLKFKPMISLIGTGFYTGTPDRELFLDYTDFQYKATRI